LPVAPEATAPGDDLVSIVDKTSDLPGLKDKLGQLRISRLRKNFPNIQTVEASYSRHRFFHWELAFADIFGGQGGFDLVLGNPPWLKLEWNEGGLLGEVDPKVAIRKMNATELAKLRTDLFGNYSGLKDGWLYELEQSEATQLFLNSTQNFHALRGVQTNLYKCFLPISWSLARGSGVVAMLHPVEL